MPSPRTGHGTKSLYSDFWNPGRIHRRRVWTMEPIGNMAVGEPQPRKLWNRLRRCAVIAGLSIAGFTSIVLLLRLVLVPVLVLLAPSLETVFFQWGVYGAYPERRYKSFDLPSPFAKTILSDSMCNSGSVLLTLDGPLIHLNNRAPTILDAKGELIWTTDEFEASANLKVQRYRGQDHLTFWAGEKLQESGLGIYYILDSSYNVAQTVSAVGENLFGDLHEFEITEIDTALIIAYNDTSLETLGRRSEWFKDEVIIDGIVQEIDIATGDLLFQWRASDYLEHPTFQATHGGHTADGTLDYFHVNSVEKDHLGNYLISIRHLHAIVYVDGKDGHILWTLGGRASDFDDISGTGVTAFKWQHDARWVDRERGIMSVFNNGVARHHYSDAQISQGLLLRLDLDELTVDLEQSFKSPTNIKTVSQGSVQMLPPGKDGDSHVFIGWGASAAYSEFDSKGKILCETHYAASSLFYFERAKSYRAIKAPTTWSAEPADWEPSAKFSGGKLYVSWNGATSVAMWRLEGRLAEEDDFEQVDLVPKQGFETGITLPNDTPHYTTYRVVALDSSLRDMRASNVLAAPKNNTAMYVSIAIMIGVAAVVVAMLLRYRAFVEKKLSYWRPKYVYHKLGETT